MASRVIAVSGVRKKINRRGSTLTSGSHSDAEAADSKDADSQDKPDARLTSRDDLETPERRVRNDQNRNQSTGRVRSPKWGQEPIRAFGS